VTSPDASARRRRVVVAGHDGDEHVARAALADPDGSVRVAALGALRRIGALAPHDLAVASADPDPGVRRRAAELAATAREFDLIPLLADGDPTVVEMAAWACGEHESARDEIVERLVELASGARDALVREAAVAALGAIGDTRAVPTIIAALDDRPAVRRRAVLALAPFDGDDVDAAIERAAADRDWQVRQAADDLRRAAR
jgi:HEAT repeat protein